MAKAKSSLDTPPIKEKWRGFRPVGYSLDSPAIGRIPLQVVVEPPFDDGTTTASTTVLSAFCDMRDSQGQIEDDIYPHVVMHTDRGNERFSGTSFAEHLLYVLVQLHKKGIDPFEARWFFYDKDFSQDAVESFTFFVVYDGKIVEERINFFRNPGDRDFEPTIFEVPSEGFEPIWRNDGDWENGETAFWYHKFYTETRTGQLMLLRPDEPILYHYQRPQVRDTLRDVQFITLQKIYRLLLVATSLLAVIAFPSTREYLGIAAAVLAANYLWVCWTTRKVGEP